MIKLAHKKSILSLLITIRNCFHQKSFPSCEENMSCFLANYQGFKASKLIEIGTGYTLTDALILKYTYNLGDIVLTDINPILNARTYSIASLLNPMNWKSKIFRSYIFLLMYISVFGEKGLRKFNLRYDVNHKGLEHYTSGCIVYSNAVLEHISITELDNLFSKIISSKINLFIGIVDTNDHVNRRLPDIEQFKNYSGDELEIQIRGNGLRLSDWNAFFVKKNITCSITPLIVKNKSIPGLCFFEINFKFNDESVYVN